MKKFILFLSAIFLFSPIMWAQSTETEPNNSSSEANTFALNSSITGQMGVSGDYYDWFKITTTKDGSLTLIGLPESSLDFYITLYDSDGSTSMKQSSSSNGAGANDTLTYSNLKAGTYYIQLTEYASTSGTYTLKNTFTETSIPDGNDTEPDDSKDNAIQLTLDSPTTGHLGFYGSGSTDYYDWYKITTTKDGSLTIIGLPENSLDFYITLYDSDGSTSMKQSSSSNGAGANDTLTYSNLKAGTYYIQLTEYASTYGSYTLKNTFTATSIPDGNDTEPNDTKENALSFTLDSSVTGHLGFYGSGSGDYYDWYKITTTKDGSLTIIGLPENSLDFYITLYDSDGSASLKQSSSSNGSGANDTLTLSNLKAGTYYIQLTEYASTYGSYTLKNTFTATSIPDGNDTEPNDTKENALSFTLDSSVTGHLGFYGSGSGDYYDWYKITTTEEHKLTLIGIPESSLDFYITLFDSDGSTALSQSSSSNGAGANDTLVYDNLPAGTYYIQLTEYASTHGSYTLKNVFTGTTTTTTLSGKVTNALDGTAIGGATVEIAGLTTTTDSNGDYTITDIPEAVLSADFSGNPTSGNAPLQVAFTDQSNDAVHTLKVSADGYVTYQNDQVAIASGETLTLDVSLSPTLDEGEIRIVLNWGENPEDLDAHLKTPSIDGNSYSIYFGNKGSATSAPYATLDHDDMHSYGPETVTITKLYDGTYKFYVYNYSKSPDISTSNAVVQVYTNDGLITSVNVPTTGTGLYWNVLTIDGSTGAVTVVNEIVSAAPVVNPPPMVQKTPSQDGENKSTKSTAGITSWSWDFGDGETSTEQNPSHTYSASGDYTVKLTVGNGSTTDTETKTSYISVNTATVSAIKGKVTNAVDGTAVSGALVQIAGLSATTDSNGNYEITDIPEAVLTADFSGTPTSGSTPLAVTFTDGSTDATHKLTVSADNYTTYVNTHVSISTGETLSMDVSLSPTLSEGEFRIVLNWGENPHDLDAHLKTPSIDGTVYSIYYGNKGSSTSGAYATLDHDDQSSYGPETVTIYKLFSGTYKYYVYNFSGSPDITTSNAVVQVYSESGLIKTINIPTSGTGRYWNVLTIDGSTGDVTVANEITASAPVINPPAATPKTPVPETEKSATSTSEITSWSWDFGDGETSTEQNPSHTYTTAGTYTVALTVSNGSENKTETKTDYITASGSSSGDTITSTTAGGNWGSSSTWIGGVVPTESDNVVIDGDVVLNYASTKCHDLTINEGTTLSGTDATSAYLRIYGDFVNNGTFDFGALMYVYKDITNNGTWTTYKLYMDDTAQQVISGDSTLKVKYFYVQHGQKIVAGSDIDFDGMNMLFQGSEFEVPTGKTVSFSRYGTYATTYLDNIILKGGGSVNFDGYMYISNSKVENITLKGTVTVKYTLDIGDSTHLSGTLENVKSYSGTVNLLSNFINDGVVRDHPDGGTLSVVVYKDLTNNGEWTADPDIKGDVNQTIKNTGTLTCEYFSLYANVSGATTYQWKKDDNDVYSGNPYTFNTNGDYYGTYYCQTDAGNSRTITIEGSGGSGGGETLLSENFDETTFPPTGWTVSTTNTSNTWSRGNPSNHPFSDVDATNVASAICPWTSENQDEWIKTPVISLPSDVSTIEFYAGFSTAYLSYATLKLKISVDGGSTWTQLWEATDDGSDWSWHKISVDISSYANNSNVIFGWEYVGADGDSVGIDDIVIKQSTTGIQNHQVAMDFTLGQNYPNPFTYRTTIPFKLIHTANVKLTVYNCLGQKVAEPVSGILTVGNHEVNFDSRGLIPGIYYYQLTLNGLSVTKRMIHIK